METQNPPTELIGLRKSRIIYAICETLEPSEQRPPIKDSFVLALQLFVAKMQISA
jgi:hypothetical protein